MFSVWMRRRGEVYAHAHVVAPEHIISAVYGLCSAPPRLRPGHNLSPSPRVPPLALILNLILAPNPAPTATGTVWEAGSAVETMQAIRANHGMVVVVVVVVVVIVMVVVVVIVMVVVIVERAGHWGQL